MFKCPRLLQEQACREETSSRFTHCHFIGPFLPSPNPLDPLQMTLENETKEKLKGH